MAVVVLLVDANDCKKMATAVKKKISENRFDFVCDIQSICKSDRRVWQY